MEVVVHLTSLHLHKKCRWSCVGIAEKKLVLHSPLLDHSISSNSRRISNGNGFSRHDKNSYTRSYSSYSRSHRDRDRDRSTIADNWDAPLQRFPSDISNGVHKNNDNGNGTHLSGGNQTGLQKVSFERDFPVLGSEDMPKTPEVIRVSSPGFSRAIQSLSIVNPPSVSSETWTSALVEAPSATTTSSSSSVSLPASTLATLKMVEALVQAPT